MDQNLVSALAVASLLIVSTVLWFVLRSTQSSTQSVKEEVYTANHGDGEAISDSESNDDEETEEGGHAAQRPLRRRGRGGARDAPAEEDPEMAGLNRLQRKKLEKQRLKEERRKALEDAQEARRVRDSTDKQKTDESERAEAERLAMEEEALQQLRDEKRQREDEEYARWAGEMSVEARGELTEEARQQRELIRTFLLERAAAVHQRAMHKAESRRRGTTEVKVAPSSDANTEEEGDMHVLVLQSTARSLHATVEKLVQAIEQLMEEKLLSGVFDERGKYILIDEQDFVEIAQFMRMRGRVSVHELARECNRIVLS